MGYVLLINLSPVPTGETQRRLWSFIEVVELVRGSTLVGIGSKHGAQTREGVPSLPEHVDDPDRPWN